MIPFIGIMNVSIGILIPFIGIMNVSIGILIASVGILIHWYFEHWYFERWYFESLPSQNFQYFLANIDIFITYLRIFC